MTIKRNRWHAARIAGLCFGALVVLLNLFPIFSAFDVYEYSNSDGTFQFREYPMKGTDLKMMEEQWKSFRDTTHQDTVLYRTFAIHPLYFWMWGSYIFNKRYRYPYLNPEVLQANEKKIPIHLYKPH